MEDERLQAARVLERQGRLEAAVKAYLEGGSPEEAARVLAGAAHSGDAGRLLSASLTVAPTDTGGQRTTMRGRALRAAILLATGGQAKAAADVFVALDNPDGAVRALLQHKQYAEAASLARRLGMAAQAADIYVQAGLAYEAGLCFMDADDGRKALEQLRRVPRDHPRYRAACVKAAQLAAELNVFGFELEQFFVRFTETRPEGEHELEAFDRLARIYLDHGLSADARDALQKVVSADPAHRDAASRLAALEGATAPGGGDLELLPDLPEAPLPPVPTRIVPMERPDTPAADGPAFVVGAVIADRYRLEQRIGAGGMAVVFRATDLDLGEEVALKVYTMPVQDEDAIARFKRELKLSRQLSNPHIVRLFDIGSYRGTRYISMELLIGAPLRARMGSRLPLATALDYLIQACAGLQAAHDAGIVHRDFKPENCFVTTSGLVKVMDFGIAKMQAAPGLTTVGIFAGTAAYISPEQIKSFGNVGVAADLYSLGVVAYELACGRVPFTHEEPMKLLVMHLNETPVPPRVHSPSLPAEMEAVILRLLEKDPARRFSSCRELAARLEEVRKRLGDPG